MYVSGCNDDGGRQGTYLGDLFADGLDTLKRLLADVGHLVSELSILATLLLLFSLILRLLLFLNVLEKSDLADLVAIVVNDIAVVVDFKTSAVTKVTSSEATDKVSVLITDLALLVDAHTRHGVDTTFLLLWFPALGLTDDVSVLVVDITILIDVVADKLLDVALDDTSDDVASLGLNSAVFDNDVVVEASERTLGTGIGASTLR